MEGKEEVGERDISSSEEEKGRKAAGEGIREWKVKEGRRFGVSEKRETGIEERNEGREE